ncbi:MAG TPA: hypothetical protein VJV79_37405 [Polyangiaceae bacterium]|nr:hypothetical protein [Polyangiaceae bacterium]
MTARALRVITAVLLLSAVAPWVLAGPAAVDSTDPSAASVLTPNGPPSSTPATIEGQEIPREASAPPQASDWASGRAVRVTRGNPGPCTLLVVREWLRVRCPTLIGAGLVAGDPRGVQITSSGSPFADGTASLGIRNQAVTTLVLPLQRGQVRLFSFLQLGEEYASAASHTCRLLPVTPRNLRRFEVYDEPIARSQGLGTGAERRPGHLGMR